MFNDFDLIGDFKVKCKTCGEEMPTGMVTLSSHWVKCTGKHFYSALMSKAESGEKLTLDAIEELQNKHLCLNATNP